MEKTLKLEISHTTSNGKVYYGTLELPASELEIEDSLQQIRTDYERQDLDEFAVYHCKPLRGLLGKRLDGGLLSGTTEESGQAFFERLSGAPKRGGAPPMEK